MLIATIILSVLFAANAVLTILLLLRNGSVEREMNTIKNDFEQLKKDFAVVEHLLTPFLQWIDDVNKQRANMERVNKEKADALANQKKE